MSRFYEIEPTLENYWRAIILFGRNSASYKFALARAMIDLKGKNQSSFSLDELAEPYAYHLCQHLKNHPKQITSKNSKFLGFLRQYNMQEISHAEMIEKTVRFGFNNVIDAFHNVHEGEVGARFYADERRSGKGIVLTVRLYSPVVQASGSLKRKRLLFFKRTLKRNCGFPPHRAKNTNKTHLSQYYS